MCLMLGNLEDSSLEAKIVQTDLKVISSEYFKLHFLIINEDYHFFSFLIFNLMKMFKIY